MLAGTGPGGPLTFLLRQKSKQKRRPRRTALRVPEKASGKAGSEKTRPRCARSSNRYRLFFRFAARFFGSSQRHFEKPNPTPKAKAKPRSKSKRKNRNKTTLSVAMRSRLIPEGIVSRIVVAVHPLGTLPKKGSTKRIRNEICLSTERSEGELFHFPLCAGFFREPEGQRPGVVSFASFSCRHKKRKWPAGASPG